MSFLRKRAAVLFFLALVITSGCRIIPWFGDYPSYDDESAVSELILSRNIDATQAFNFNTTGFKLSIPAGALETDSKIEITRYPLLNPAMNLPKEYKPLSELYAIKFVPPVTTLSQAATIRFQVNESLAGQTRFAAHRNEKGEWKFASPLPQESATEISFETLNFSDWVLVERARSFSGALSQGLQITASPSAAIASITGFFEEDIELSVCLKADQPLNISPANSQLKIQLANYDSFSIDLTSPDSPDSSRNYTSDTDGSVSIDLLSASLARTDASGNNATYTTLLKLKGKTPEELPTFLALSAFYTTESGINYSAVQTLTFSKAPPVDENTPTAPRISDTIPINGADQIAGNTGITIVFDSKMNLESVQNALNIADRAGNSVSGSFSWQEDRVLTFTPAQTLLPATEYVISFSDGAVGLNGLALTVEGESVFTTAGSDPAELVSYTPADNALSVAFDTPIFLKFSQPIDPANLKFTVSPAIAGDFTATWNDSKTEVTILFGSGYTSNQVYEVSVLETTLDSYGQAIKTSYSFSFTSETYVASRLIGIQPASGSVDIMPDAAFIFTFDQPMNEAETQQQISFSPVLSGIAYTWSEGSTRLAIAYADKLQTGTDYVVTIGKTAENQLLTSYIISYRVIDALQVTSTIPADGTSGISVGQSVEVRFNNPVETSTLALTVSPSPAAGFTNIWSDENRLLTLIPNADLLEEQIYQFTIGKTVADTFGTSPDSNYVFSFTTGTVTPPTITSTQPVAGSYDVPVNQQIKILFSKAMDQTKTQAAVTVSPAVTPAFTWENADTTMVISLGETLAYDTSYQITVGTGATDKSGLALAQNYQLGFKTVTRPAVLSSKCYPTSGASGIPPQAVVKIEFSKAMNKDSAQTAFSLKLGSTAINGNFSWSGNIMSFTPAATLSYGQTYQISVADTALDSLGNSLSAAVSWSFTTAADEGKVWVLEQQETEGTTTFSKRSEHVMIGFNNKLWVIGGFDGTDYLNDVWSSSDGSNWTREAAAAAFGTRSGHSCAVYDGAIWLTGGYSEATGLYDDVWKSSDGKNWTQVSSSADYYARHGHSMAVFSNKLWIIGGQGLNDGGASILLDDCWSSSNGLTWTQNSSIVSFFPRKLHTSGVVNGRMWVWGGYGEDADSNLGALNDAWSTADGEFWRLEASSVAFPARCAAAATTFNDRIWMIGGANDDPYLFGTTYYNDIWASADGMNWVQILDNSAGSSTQFSPRVLLGAATAGTKLFVSGGEKDATTGYELSNEVWSTE
ncbi:MAG: hypothetical protein GX569_17245 [Candidatus Riflebacteria bacterium]|nr:hypothetical protein [Candidatus Riflebacteria bacterium]